MPKTSLQHMCNIYKLWVKRMLCVSRLLLPIFAYGISLSYNGNHRLAPVSNVIFFSKTDILSKIAIYKLYLEVEVLGLDITKFDYQRG